MAGLLVYSSRTGNTLKIVEAAREVLPDDTVFAPAREAPDPQAFERVFAVFWVDAGAREGAQRRAFPPRHADLESARAAALRFVAAVHNTVGA